MVDFKKLMSKKGGPRAKERPSRVCLEGNCEAAEAGIEQYVSLGEAVAGEMQCQGCGHMIVLTRDDRWDTFDYIDDKIDGLFTEDDDEI